MARDIPVGNGVLHVCFDAEDALRDLYFPHVGQENHLGCGRLYSQMCKDIHDACKTA